MLASTAGPGPVRAGPRSMEAVAGPASCHHHHLGAAELGGASWGRCPQSYWLQEHCQHVLACQRRVFPLPHAVPPPWFLDPARQLTQGGFIDAWREEEEEGWLVTFWGAVLCSRHCAGSVGPAAMAKKRTVSALNEFI